MIVPLLDLKKQYESIKPEIDAALQRVVAAQQFILGPEVENLERSLQAYLGCRHAIGVSSGTDALLLALMALGIGPGDEVIVPDYSFFATAGAVVRLGAKPVFADIHLDDFNLAADQVERRVTPRTRALIPVHLFGQGADMDAISAIASRHRLAVVEDAAQAIGARHLDGRCLGTIGHAGCFSFFPSKNLGAFGDGGLVTTDDDALAERLRLLRVHGARPKYHHQAIGGNFRLDAIQAAVLEAKLPHLDAWHDARRRNADLYHRLLQATGLAGPPGTPPFAPGQPLVLPVSRHRSPGLRHPHIYNQYVIRTRERDDLAAFLKRHGVATEVYYPVPFHRQPCFAGLAAGDPEYPEATEAAATSLALPVHAELREEQIAHVCERIAAFFSRREA